MLIINSTLFYNIQYIISWPAGIVTVYVFRPSVLYTNISETKRGEVDLWLLWNLSRKLDFLIQKLPLDSRPEVVSPF